MQGTLHRRTDRRLQAARVDRGQPRDGQACTRLPSAALIDLTSVMFCQCEIKRAGRIELDINSSLFEECGGKVRIHISALTGETEKLIAGVGFCLRGKHSCRGK